MSFSLKNLIYILGLSFFLVLPACAETVTAEPEFSESDSISEAEAEAEVEVEVDSISEVEATLAAAANERKNEEDKSLAMQGDVEAQLRLGNSYLYGYDVPKDAVKAARWFEAAAENGNAEAQYELASMYGSYSSGLDVDLDKSMEWYRRSASQGYEYSQLALAYAYSLGYNSNNDTDYVKAAEWATKAALQGNERAQRFIASCYMRGEGVIQNKTIARKWYEQSCSNGSDTSCSKSNRLISEGY